ncbi:MAG: AAA family ATPase, partial [Clostridia bacterium]|nr:AAA family ATPase [Clostridia bacterium]
MITSLYIKNIALIREHTLEFSEGLNVLSGETGAGKSIIIDSLNFVLGDRADKSLIRHGQSSATVEAVFNDNNNANVINVLAEFGIERDETLIVKRTMTENGRSDCRINGRAVTLAQLRKLVAHLVDIHSQHENQALLNEANHILILDKYGKSLGELKEKFNLHYNAYLKAKADINAFEDESSRARKIDNLEYQIAEIERINPQ